MFKISTSAGEVARNLPDEASAMRALRSAVGAEVGRDGRCHHGMISTSCADGLAVVFYTGPSDEDKATSIIMTRYE